MLDHALARNIYGVLPKDLHAMTCKWWLGPSGQVAKGSGKSECKSRSLAMLFQVVVLCVVAFCCYTSYRRVFMFWLKNEELRTRILHGGGSDEAHSHEVALDSGGGSRR